MKNPSRPLVPWSRRQALSALGLSLGAGSVLELLGCSGAAGDVVSGASGAGAAGAAGNAGSAGTAGASGASGDAAAWATGGTASMTGDYPDPFSAGLGTSCTLTCSATLGPCYAETLTRQDISEGHDGLPVRLAFLIVDETCQPIEGASVDIWHAAPEGVYSGSDAAAMCTLSDPDALVNRWFRGVQSSDANGRVDFDTCFPGWYSGRTIHIHFTIRVGGVEYVTSQLFFDDALDDEIVATQPLYNDRGSRDTSNTTDSVISASEVASYTFETARMADGAMLAWKALVIRSSTASALCAVQGGTGGPGAPPGAG